jgi:multidrug transporter EmrE-like cation transporter
VSPKDLVVCAAFALVLPTGQTLFKWGAVYNETLSGDFVGRILQNYPLMIALAWYGLSALLWFYILTRVPLSAAYPFALAGGAIVPLVGWLVFKEPASWTMVAGYLLMLVGLGLIAARPAA